MAVGIDNLPTEVNSNVAQDKVLEVGERYRIRFMVRDIPVTYTDSSLYALRNLVMNPHKWRGELNRQGIEIDPHSVNINWREGKSHYIQGGVKYRVDTFEVTFTYMGPYDGGSQLSGLGFVVTGAIGAFTVGALLVAAAKIVAMSAAAFVVVATGIWLVSKAAKAALTNVSEGIQDVGEKAFPTLLVAAGGVAAFLWLRRRK